jgi:hypothetical protein
VERTCANGNGANFFNVDGANATSMYFGNARGGERVAYIFGENSIEEEGFPSVVES